MDTQPKITHATITPSDSKQRRYQASVTAEFDDGTTVKDALRWYDDELTFTTEEFVGLTRQGVNNLFLEKDRIYLQS